MSARFLLNHLSTQEGDMDIYPDMTELEKRISRIEQQLGRSEDGRRNSGFHPAWPFALGLAAIVLGILGVGYPRHYYQVLFSLLLLLLLYHRGFLLEGEGKWKWPLIFVNFLLLSLLFQLLIGGGVSYPFDWVRLPAIAKAAPAQEQSWYTAVMPDYTVQWQVIPALAAVSIDITKIQTFLFLAVLAGALFRFEPFTSIAALALILVSLPAYLRFDWDWIVPFIIAGSVSIYLQAQLPRGKEG